MKRADLDRLKHMVADFQHAILVDKRAEAAHRRAKERRKGLAQELADELAAVQIPEGEGFEHAGLVVWFEGEAEISLGHVFLAHYHRRRGE